jgi:aryl carrier-like protein
MAVSARDKKTLLTLLEQAQLVYLLTRLPKKQVLDDEKDVARLEAGLAAVRAAAGELSPALRKQHEGVQWDELAEKPDSPDLLWRRAKRVGPQVLRELRPLLEGEPEAAFMLDPTAEAKKTVDANKKPAPRKRAARK